MEDYYKILGVDKTATQEEIKKAYRSLSLKWHPDRNQNNKEADEKMRKLNEAFQTLGDVQKRKTYDNPSTQFDINDIFNGGGSGFGDIFTEIFGGGQRNSQNQLKPFQYKIPVTISFREALFGKKHEIIIPSHKKCIDCNGTGGKRMSCTECNGSGKLVKTMGTMQFITGCSKCNGTGNTIVNACQKCNGDGNIQGNKKVLLTIPAGLSNGITMHLDTGPGDLSDVFVIITTQNHPHLSRNGSATLSSCNISCIDAMLGTTIKLNLIDGEETIELPSGVVHQQQIKVLGKGGAINDSDKRADHILTVNITIPKISDADILNKLREVKTMMG